MAGALKLVLKNHCKSGAHNVSTNKVFYPGLEIPMAVTSCAKSSYGDAFFVPRLKRGGGISARKVHHAICVGALAASGCSHVETIRALKNRGRNLRRCPRISDVPASSRSGFRTDL